MGLGPGSKCKASFKAGKRAGEAGQSYGPIPDRFHPQDPQKDPLIKQMCSQHRKTPGFKVISFCGPSLPSPVRHTRTFSEEITGPLKETHMREAHRDFDRKMVFLVFSGSQTGEMRLCSTYVEMKHILKLFFFFK